MAKGIGLNLDILKKEIEDRKSEKGSVSSNLGESVNYNNISPTAKGNFLQELMASVQYNRNLTNESLEKIDRIKTINNNVALKLGETPVHQINETPSHKSSINFNPNNGGYDEERDDQLYRDIEQKTNLTKRTLGESIQNQMVKNTNHNIPMNMNQQPQYLGEDYVSNMKKIVNNQILENVTPILNEAIKDMIVEIYTREKIKDVLIENSDMIEKVVYDVLRKIKDKNNKAKAQ